MVELGTKHECVECGKKFYDLGKDPAICPACGTNQVDPEAEEEKEEETAASSGEEEKDEDDDLDEELEDEELEDEELDEEDETDDED